MIHARSDYNRIQDPATTNPKLLSIGSAPIAQDEPVMLFRAQDQLAPMVLLGYANLLMAHGAEEHMVDSVIRHATQMLQWQSYHPSKRPPDMPRSTVTP